MVSKLPWNRGKIKNHKRSTLSRGALASYYFETWVILDWLDSWWRGGLEYNWERKKLQDTLNRKVTGETLVCKLLHWDAGWKNLGSAHRNFLLVLDSFCVHENRISYFLVSKKNWNRASWLQYQFLLLIERTLQISTGKWRASKHVSMCFNLSVLLNQGHFV